MRERMRMFVLGLGGGVVVGLLGAGAAAAQEPSPRTTVGWGVSMYNFSAFAEGVGEGSASDAALETSVGGLLFIHHWLNPWLGLQVDAAYSRPELTLPTQAATVAIWTASAGATLRPLGAPRPVAPYGMASVGMISYGLGGPSLRLNDSGLILDTGRTEQLMFQFGAGVDVLLLALRGGDVLGLRAEMANLMVTARPFRVENRSDQGGHSHWRISLGLHTSIPR